MFCPKCGTENPCNALRCQTCGFILQEEVTLSVQSDVAGVSGKESKEIIREHFDSQILPVPETLDRKPGLGRMKKLGIVFWGLAVVVVVLSFVAAVSLAVGGAQISEIKSVGGKTLEEAYYGELCLIYSGYAWLSAAFGIFMSGILAYLGFVIYHREEKKEQ